MLKDSSNKLNSLLKILRILNRGGRYSPSQLAEELEVTERTVYRYITSLQGAGYPIFFDRSVNSYCFTDGYRLTEQTPNNELYQALDLKSKMVGSLAVGLLSYDQTGRCIVANDHAAIIIGGNREQILGQNYNELQSWERSGLLLMAKKVMKTGIEYHGDFHVFSTFGREVWFLCSLTRYEQNGNYLLLVVFQDITGHKKIVTDLRELALQFQVLANTSMDAFWLLDENGNFLDVNDRACLLYGYSREELLTIGIKDIEADENPDEVQLHIDKVMNNGYDRFDTRQLRKDGSLIHVEVSTARITGTNKLLAFNRELPEARSKELIELRNKVIELEKLLLQK